MKQTKPCGVPLTRDRFGDPELEGPKCDIPRAPAKVKCQWHHLLRQPIDVQVKAAKARRREQERLCAGLTRARVPAEEWPAGTRWCADCQTFVPLFYVSGSRCRACNSAATHASHVKRTYDLDPAEYDRLLAWQGGVCFICGQRPRARRLAVDHDHQTGAVRGLICANNEWGCNVTLSRLLNDLEMAKRALLYVERPPLERMRQGEPQLVRPRRPTTMDLVRAAVPAQASEPAPVPAWDPFS